MTQTSEEQFLKTYTISEVSKLIDVTQSLLRSWEKEFDLEIPRWKEGIGKGNRYYTQFEIDTLRNIKLLRDKNVSRNIIRDTLRKQKEKGETSENDILSHVNPVVPPEYSMTQLDAIQMMKKLPEDLQNYLKEELDRFALEVKQTALKEVREGLIRELKTTLVEEVRNELQASQKLIAASAEQSIKDSKEERINEMLIRDEVKEKLKEEALLKWMDKPKTERFIKTGLFSMVEDVSQRDLFMKRYVNERFEKELRKALDL